METKESITIFFKHILDRIDGFSDGVLFYVFVEEGITGLQDQ
jgi:hypothetical protein